MSLNTASSTSFKLSNTERERFLADGYLVREAVFDNAEVEGLRDAAEQAVSRANTVACNGTSYHLDGKRFVDVEDATLQYEHSPGSSTLRVLEPVHLFDQRIDRLVDDARLAFPMQDLVGTHDLSLWTAKLNLKRKAGSGFGWHQDSPYWIHDCDHVDQLPNVMIALDEQNTSNGCFRVIARSHLQGILPGCTDGSQLGGFFTHQDCFDEQDQVAMTVPAGSVIFFSPHSIHGSQPNVSAQPRRALILTYQPGDRPMLKTGTVRNINVGN